MNQEITPSPMADIEQILISGDLARLTPEQRLTYYGKVCESVSLNPLTKPFDFITLNGKLVLYANKGCAEQLRKVHKISLKITNRETIEGVYVVTVEASGPDGRTDGATGAVPIQGLKGDHLANAFLKAETKAKRRVTLSICGLNMLDEIEVSTISRVAPSQPPSDGLDGNTNDGVYRITFGQWKGRSLEEVYRNEGPEKIISYVDYLERVAEKKNQPLGAMALEFIEKAEEFLGALEMPKIEDGKTEEIEPGWDG